MHGMTMTLKRGVIPDDLLKAIGELAAYSSWLEGSLRTVLSVINGLTPGPYGEPYQGYQRKGLETEIAKGLMQNGSSFGISSRSIQAQWEEELSPRLERQRLGRNAVMHDLTVFCIEAGRIVRVQSKSRDGKEPVEFLEASTIELIIVDTLALQYALFRFNYNLIQARSDSPLQWPTLFEQD